MTQDFNLKITVRNARLLRAIRKDHDTAAEFARRFGICKTSLAALITMKKGPFREDGSFSAAAEQIVSALGVSPDDIWPEHIARLRAKQAHVEVEMSAENFALIAQGDEQKQIAYRIAIDKWLVNLPERQRTALLMEAEGATLDEIGREVGGVSRERARQILHKAQRNVRTKARLSRVTSIQDIA
jgi:lambda repressor-like predicted transcriptional regulator